MACGFGKLHRHRCGEATLQVARRGVGRGDSSLGRLGPRLETVGGPAEGDGKGCRPGSPATERGGSNSSPWHPTWAVLQDGEPEDAH